MAHRPPNNLCSRIPFLLYFCLLLTTHLFTLGDPYHYLKLIKDTFFSLQCCALLYPNRIAYNTALKTWLSVCLFFFFSLHAFWYVPALFERGKVAHSIFCFFKTNVYLRICIYHMYVETMNVSKLDA